MKRDFIILLKIFQRFILIYEYENINVLLFFADAYERMQKKICVLV